MQLTENEIIEITNIPTELRYLIEQSEFKSQNKFKKLRGIKVGNLYNNLLSHLDFRDKRVVDFGAGHFGFSLIAKRLGANVTAFEYDNSFYHLGQRLKINTVREDFTQFDFSGFGTVDFLFAKGVFVANRYSPEQQNTIFDNWSNIIAPNTNIFFSTVNPIAAAELKGDALIRYEFSLQKFLSLNLRKLQLSEHQKRAWGINHTGADHWVNFDV
jgi:2-polyprenyl-3-methyl-5-hydroxy-6-metoxy-1,4-benzoquinol methylase